MSLILNQVPGVVENGLFIDICDVVITGHGNGTVDVKDINSGESETAEVRADNDNVFLHIAE